MREKYQAQPVDIAWANEMVRIIKDGGTLAYPATQLIYTLDSTAKVLTLQNPEILSDPDSRETHERTCDVFPEIGWTVKTVPCSGS